MKVIAGFIMLLSIWSWFGMEEVKSDDISVYDPPKQENSISESTEYNKQYSDNSTADRGYIFGDDELHVIGIPSNKKGYSAAGYYGNETQSGKGWVYDADELHVIGLPSGDDGYTLSGYYGDIDR